MESLMQTCSIAGVLVFAIVSWITLFWTISPFISEAAIVVHRTYGY
jgi:hypothetical protein